ncbi:MAG: FAD-dependent oxidoreductase, partial [Kiloniellales bacterium]|nr:FAD-dependent oxidoreductase [Kiloniellales bacterium]
KPLKPVLNRVLLSPRLHVKQDPDGALVMGRDFGGGPEPEDFEAERAALFNEMQKLLRTGDELELAKMSLGLRPIPADGHPVIGYAPDWPQVYLAVMHSGVTLMPVVAQIAAAEVGRLEKADVAAAFRPDRFVFQ